MKKNFVRNSLIYTVFFASGATGLIFQVIWIRQLLLIFGSTTHSIVAVLAAYMAGLAIGSYFVGKYLYKVSNLLKLYTILELLVGFFTLSTLVSFPLIQDVYQATFSGFSSSTQTVLFYKFVLSSLAILPATIAMGGTLPTLVSHFRKKQEAQVAASRLYGINTLGAFFGTFVSAFFMIELLGLRNSLIAAAVVNLVIAVIVSVINTGSINHKRTVEKSVKLTRFAYSKTEKIVLVAFGISGLVSLAYEVLWTRLLTPTAGTFIYAFAGILSTFLIGIALGSFLFEKLSQSKSGNILTFGLLELGIGLAALASIVVDTNFPAASAFNKVVLTIIPATIFMGMTFPAVVKIITGGRDTGGSVGTAYFFNTVGSIIGSILAAYFFIPVFGTVRSVLFLTSVNFVIAYVLFVKDVAAPSYTRRILMVLSALFILGSLASQALPKSALYEARMKETLQIIHANGTFEKLFMEDEIASVLGYRQIDGKYKALFIDGIQTTSPGPDTTLLAHLPYALNSDAKNMLVIAFGMGGTYRSALIHDNLYVDVVDLVPSVPKMFHLFHSDAADVLKNSRGQIIINDGRNYVRTTDRKYDIIVVDPPPPVNAAGTTVLYSTGFYEDSKKILNPDGLFVAWFYTGATIDDFKHLFASFSDAFPNILAIESVISNGYYLIGSASPINVSNEKLQEVLRKPEIYYDNNKTLFDGTLKIDIRPITEESICERVLGDGEVVKKFINGADPVTDDKPITEYFLLRRNRTDFAIMKADYLNKFNSTNYCSPNNTD